MRKVLEAPLDSMLANLKHCSETLGSEIHLTGYTSVSVIPRVVYWRRQQQNVVAFSCKSIRLRRSQNDTMIVYARSWLYLRYRCNIETARRFSTIIMYFTLANEEVQFSYYI